MNFYENYRQMYKAATMEKRIESKKHWIKCHENNLKSRRQDLIIFSGQILAMIAIVDNEENERI